MDKGRSLLRCAATRLLIAATDYDSVGDEATTKAASVVWHHAAKENRDLANDIYEFLNG